MQNRPVTKKYTEVKMNDHIYVASSSMQGWREDTEDTHRIQLQSPMDRSCIYVGLFDGHHGSSVANFAQKYLQNQIFLRQEYREGDIRAAIEQGFLALDKLMLDDPIINAEEAGSTALVILIKNGIIHCGNLGDSRAVACVKGKPKKLSNDHKPNVPEELQRIQQAGCKVIRNRVNGRLAVSRSLGNLKYKCNKSLPPALQAVTGFPEVIIDIIKSDWEFLLMATDGIFNSMSSEGNLGDSRAVACVKGKPKKLSNDHKPNVPEELQRIQQAGCKVIRNRVNGRLAVSRSLGNLKYKCNKSLPPALQAVTGFPEVIIDIIKSDWEFLLMATDGIFNSMSSEELITYIHAKIVQGVRPEDITELVLKNCLSPNRKGRGSDNMSLILILFMSNIEKDYVKKLKNLPESRSCPSSSQYLTWGSDPGPITSKTD